MRRRGPQSLLFLLLLLVLPSPARAHVGSKDVFEQLTAGPYKLFVTVRPPIVIPGVAVVEIRVSGARANSLRITPVPMIGEASKHPPTADAMKQSAVDPAFFTGAVWLMAPGSWKVEITVDGAGGAAATSIPVPAMPLAVLRMDRTVGFLLGGLGLLLTAGIAGIVAAATRESRLAPGVAPTPQRKRRALFAGLGTLALVAWMAWLGGRWWNAEAASYSSAVYQPLGLQATLSGKVLDLKIAQVNIPGKASRNRSNADLLSDHGHLMHLYVLREPGMDAVYHLHPALVAPGDLQATLPSLPGGHYRLFADIVHRSGLPETLTATLDIPEGFHGAPLDAEDAAAAPPPISAGELGPADKLPDGYSMVWDKPSALVANQPVLFRFHLLNAQGQPATDVVPYLGMAGHAAFVKTDWTTFAHTHPEGSAPMPSMMLANDDAGSAAMPGMAAPGESAQPLSPTVEFPYGFPAAGRYRIFVQMKHGSTVETGVFDAEVR